MVRNGKSQGGLQEAKPPSGDLVDRFLHGKLREALFGAEEELCLGRLRIEGSLGRGAMGAILSAFDPVLDRHVAIKSLLPGRSEDRDQLLREARLLAKLDHRNVVSIYDVLEEEDALYLVMEQVKGSDLRAWMGSGRPWREVLELFIQLGQGLAAAHALEIAHCDIKPENILVSAGRPRLIDFGLAHQRSDGPGHGGTPAYLAPERIAGGQGTAAADQYAFFATLVEAIEGKRPGAEKRWEKMPAWLQAVARRGLQTEPEDRFANMQEALLALQPMRTRTKLAIAGGGTLVLGLGLALALFAGREGKGKSSACLGSEAQLEGVWTPETQSSMKSAFLGSGVEGAEAAWLETEASMSAYSDTWLRLRTQSCIATRVHQEQSAELMDFSMRCFDERLTEMRALASLFANAPNEAVVRGAKKAVGGLGELAACVDPASLEAAVPLPQEPEKRERLRELQARVQEVKNYDRRAEYQQGLDLSEELLSPSLELGYAPLSVDLLVTRAALQVTLGQHAEAEKTLESAASAAARAKDDARAAEVWIRLMDLRGQQSRYDEALTLEPVARSSAERVPENYEIQARLHNSLGGLYLAKAKYPEAHAAYEKALAAQYKIGTDGNAALGPAIANFALAKWYTGDLEGALEDLNEALVIVRDQLGADHSQVAYIRQNIADLLRQLGRGDEAYPHYQDVLRIWTITHGAEHANLAYPLEQLAMLAKGRGDFEDARQKIQEALRLREESLGPDHALVLQGLTVAADIAIAEGSKESLARAEEAVERAMGILENLGEPGKRHAVYVLESRAQIAEIREDWQAALADRQQVLALRVETLGAEHRDTGFSYAQIGRMKMKLGQLAEAARDFKTAQTIFEAHPGIRDDDAISMRQGRAEVLLLQGKADKAIAMFEDALMRAEAAKLERVYELRFALAKARYRAGHTERALAEMDALQAELPADKEAIASSLKSWRASL